MSFDQAFATASSHPFDTAALEELARSAIAEGEEEQALPLVGRAVAKGGSARLWQWKGLLERSLDEHGDAVASFERAAALDPSDMAIAHAHARAAMEAGLDAQALYEHARTLAPRNGVLIVGLAAARAAAGKGQLAAAELDEAVARAPAWLEGHQQLAQLLATLGRADEATGSIERAIARFPGQASLWETWLHIQLRRGAYSTLEEIADRAASAGVESPELAIFRAIHAAECSSETLPAALFDKAPAGADEPLRSWRIRHLLRSGAADK
jgi:tetratricopeptide (TPR) repeat protein